MNKKELLAKLAPFPDDMDVMLIQTNDESAYNMVNTVEVRPIVFGEDDIPRDEWATEECIVISDEF